MIETTTCFAVVPVFVNAGAAVLPALLAGLASAFAMLLQPRELLRVVRARPGVTLVVLASLTGLGFLFWRTAIASDAPAATRTRRAASASPANTDWAQVALEIIRQEERLAALGAGVNLDDPRVAEPKQQTVALGFRLNPGRTGHDGGRAPLGLLPLWEYVQPRTMFLSSPVAQGDAVYAASCQLDPPGSFGSVVCLDARTGKEQWRNELCRPEVDFKGFFSSPTLTADGKHLLIGQGLHFDTDCELVCLDAKTGKVRWLVKTPLHIEGSPAVEGDIVVAGAGAVEKGPKMHPVGDPGYVFAVRISDGKELWRHKVNDPESSPVIADGIAFVGSGLNGSAVLALRVAPSEELAAQKLDRQLWKTATPFPATGAVTLAGDLVLVGCGKGNFVFADPDPEGAVLALDRKTGQERWRVALPDAVLGPIAVRDGKAVVPVRNGEVVMLDLAQSGKVLWRERVSGKAPVLAGPAFTGRCVYAVSQDGYLAVFDAANGKVIEKHYINARNKPGELGLSVSAPVIIGGRLYVGSETGGLRCFAGKELK